jgi:hypothetical protein
MTMLKVFENLKAVQGMAVPDHYEPTDTFLVEADQSISPHFDREYQYTFTATCYVSLTGKPSELPQIKQRAIQLLAHEIYGDIRAEISKLWAIYYCSWKFDEDFARRLEALLRKLEGADQ